MNPHPELAPDTRALLGGLHRASFGRPLFVLDVAESTMDEARRLWQAGAPWGATVVAGMQTAGRGRRGKRFVSPQGGLYLTVLTEPCGPPVIAWRAGFAAALAVHDAVLSVGGPVLALDWPNDLYWEQRKVGGVLAEWLSAGPAGAAAVAIGVGLNLGPDPREVDAETAGPAGSLRLPDVRAGRELVAAAFLGRLFERMQGIGTELGWRHTLESVRSVLLRGPDHQVVLRLADGTCVKGSPHELQTDGTLIVRRDDGELIEVRHAERWID